MAMTKRLKAAAAALNDMDNAGASSTRSIGLLRVAITELIDEVEATRDLVAKNTNARKTTTRKKATTKK